MGGKPLQRLWAFWKKCRFRHRETIDSFHKIGLKFPGILNLEVHFWWCPVNYREIALENTRDVFLLSHRHALLQRATSDLKKFFLIWSSSNAIATPWCFASVLGSRGCWLWSQDCMVWPILWKIALWLYAKQITTWSLLSTGYKVLFLFYICINICAHPTIMMPARGNPDAT